MLFLKRHKYIILAAIFLLATMYWLIEGGTVNDKKIQTPKTTPNAIIKEGELSEEKNGKKVWELKAKTIEFDSNQNQSNLTDIVAKLYREDGTYIDVTSKNGIYDTQNKKITLHGDVLAVYSQGWTLKCQKLEWSQSGKTIEASTNVELVKGDVVALGDKIQTDDDFKQFKLAGNAVVERR